MTWVKLDDEFYINPKVVAAGPLGISLYVCALSYCGKHLTDGFIPRRILPTLLNVEGVWDKTYPAGSEDDSSWTLRETAGVLVELGLWEVIDGGYQVHDYLTYNPTREQVEATREAKVEAGKLGAERRWAGRRIAAPMAPPMAGAIAEGIAAPMANECSRTRIPEEICSKEEPAAAPTRARAKNATPVDNGSSSEGEKGDGDGGTDDPLLWDCREIPGWVKRRSDAKDVARLVTDFPDVDVGAVIGQVRVKATAGMLTSDPLVALRAFCAKEQDRKDAARPARGNPDEARVERITRAVSLYPDFGEGVRDFCLDDLEYAEVLRACKGAAVAP
jgi:hypothetical protein